MARTRQEVLDAKRTIQGCCDRFADNMGCDCLLKAVGDDPVAKAIAAEREACALLAESMADYEPTESSAYIALSRGNVDVLTDAIAEAIRSRR